MARLLDDRIESLDKFIKADKERNNNLPETFEWELLWLKELKAYRNIIDTAEEKIKDIYGAVIVEGYADIFDQLKEIRRDNNDRTNIREGE